MGARATAAPQWLQNLASGFKGAWQAAHANVGASTGATATAAGWPQWGQNFALS
nr:hypothetical protein [Comamonas denitrificans]